MCSGTRTCNADAALALASSAVPSSTRAAPARYRLLGSTPQLSTRISWGILPGYARVWGARVRSNNPSGPSGDPSINNINNNINNNKNNHIINNNINIINNNHALIIIIVVITSARRGPRPGEEGIQQDGRTLSRGAWLRTLGRKLGSTPRLSTRISWGVLPGYARVCGASSPLPPWREQLCQWGWGVVLGAILLHGHIRQAEFVEVKKESNNICGC
jgi:hypothetical protein